MKMLIIGLVMIGLAVVGGIYLMKSNSSKPTIKSGEDLQFSEVEADIKVGGQLIDVRTPEEYAAGHIAAAANLPLGSMQSGTLPTAAKDSKIYVHCRSGNRSAQAKVLLENSGYTDVVDLGGMQNVIAIGGSQVN